MGRDQKGWTVDWQQFLPVWAKRVSEESMMNDLLDLSEEPEALRTLYGLEEYDWKSPGLEERRKYDSNFSWDFMSLANYMTPEEIVNFLRSVSGFFEFCFSPTPSGPAETRWLPQLKEMVADTCQDLPESG